MTGLTLTVSRMTRLTWHKHRVSMLGVPAAFAAAAVALFIAAFPVHYWLSAHHCLAVNPSGNQFCNGGLPGPATPGNTYIIAGAVLALPALAGLFAGVPWVAREFESGAFRYTWTQGVSPRRWLIGTFAPLALLATVAAAACGLAAAWWYQCAQYYDGTSADPWRAVSFELTPLSIASWTLLAMALALLAGVVIRRVLPAMIAFLVAFGGCAWLAQTWLRTWMLGIGTVTRQVNTGWPGGAGVTSYITRTWFTTRSGQPVAASNLHLTPSHDLAWMEQHYIYIQWIAYQPYSHLAWLELARNGVLVAIAALTVRAAQWWLRIRPAE
jgi:hypothetical protein